MKFGSSVLLLCLFCPTARAEWLYNSLTQPALARFEPSLKNALRLEVGVPIDEQGSAGVTSSVAVQHRLAKWLALSAELGWIMGADSETRSILGLDLKVGWTKGSHTKHGSGGNFALLGDLRFELGTDSAVIEPVLILAAALGPFGAELYAGPNFAFPVRDIDTRGIATGFLYGAMLNTSVYLCHLGLGFRGFESFGGDQTHYALEVGLRAHIKSPEIFPFVRATIPLSNDSINLATAVVFGVNWLYSAQ